MPRRRELKIVLGQLKRSANIYSALENDPILEGYDLSTLTISVKAKITPYIKIAERAAEFLEHYLAANPNCCYIYKDIKSMQKSELSKMMNVGRSTFDKWLKDGLITPRHHSDCPKVDFFDPFDILDQLKKINNTTCVK